MIYVGGGIGASSWIQLRYANYAGVIDSYLSAAAVKSQNKSILARDDKQALARIEEILAFAQQRSKCGRLSLRGT